MPRADFAHNDPNQHKGIFDLEQANNPIKDWTAVFVPYCTGDIHLGSTTREYNTEDGKVLTINHYGAINVGSVLNWLGKNQSPKQVVVSGASAGAMAAPIYAGRLASMYPDAKYAVLLMVRQGMIPPGFADFVPVGSI